MATPIDPNDPNPLKTLLAAQGVTKQNPEVAPIAPALVSAPANSSNPLADMLKKPRVTSTVPPGGLLGVPAKPKLGMGDLKAADDIPIGAGHGMGDVKEADYKTEHDPGKAYQLPKEQRMPGQSYNPEVEFGNEKLIADQREAARLNIEQGNSRALGISEFKQHTAQQELLNLQAKLGIPTDKLTINYDIDADDRVVVDKADVENKLTTFLANEAAHKMGAESWADMPKWFAEEKGHSGDVYALSDADKATEEQMRENVWNTANHEARARIAQAGAYGRHYILVDTDPNHSNEEISKELPILRELHAVLQPRGQTEENEEVSQYQPARASDVIYRAVNAWPAISAARYKNYANSDAPAKLLDGDIPGWYMESWRSLYGLTPEQSLELVKEVRRNPSIAEYMADQSGKLAELTVRDMDMDEANKKRIIAGATVWGGLQGFLTGDVASPDPVSMGLEGVSATAKAVMRVDSHLSRFGAKVSQLGRTASNVSEAISAVEKVEPAQAQLLLLHVAADSKVNADVLSALGKLKTEHADALEKLNEIKAKYPEGFSFTSNEEMAIVRRDIAEAEVREKQANLRWKAANLELARDNLATSFGAVKPVVTPESAAASKTAKAQTDYAGITEMDAALTHIRKEQTKEALSDFEKGEGLIAHTAPKIRASYVKAEQEIAEATARKEAFQKAHGPTLDALKAGAKDVEEKRIAAEQAKKVYNDLKAAKRAKSNQLATDMGKAKAEIKEAIAAPNDPASKAKLTHGSNEVVRIKAAAKALADQSLPEAQAILGAEVDAQKAIREYDGARTVLEPKMRADGWRLKEEANIENDLAKATATKESIETKAAEIGIRPTEEHPAEVLRREMQQEIADHEGVIQGLKAEAKEAYARAEQAKAVVKAEAERAKDAAKAVKETEIKRRKAAVEWGIEINKAVRHEVSKAKVDAKAADKYVQDVIDAGEEYTKAEMRVAGLENRKEMWRTTFQKYGDRLIEGAKARKTLLREPTKFTDIITESGAIAAQTKKTDKRAVNVAKLTAYLDQKYGAETIAHLRAQKTPAGNVLNYITAVAERNGGKPVILHGDRLPALQGIITEVAKASRTVHPSRAAIDLVDTIDLIRKYDNTHRPPWGFSPKQIINRLGYIARRILTTYDPLIHSIGPADYRIKDVMRASKNMSAQLDDEYITLARYARWWELDQDMVKRVSETFGIPIPDRGQTVGGIPPLHRRLAPQSDDERRLSQIAALMQHVNTNIGVPYVGGTTFMNTLTGEAPWRAIVQQVTTDPRVESYGGKLREWAKEYDTIQARTVRGEEGLISPKMPEPTEEEQMTAPVVLALARVWFPSMSTRVADRTAATLYGRAVEILKAQAPEGRDLIDFLVSMKKATAAPEEAGGLGATEQSLSRVIGFASRAAGHGFVQHQANELMFRAIGGAFTPEQIKDVSYFLQGDYKNVGNIDNVTNFFTAIGKPMTQDEEIYFNRTTTGAYKGAARGITVVNTGQLATGQDIFMTGAMASEIDKNLPRVVKELNARSGHANLPSEILGFDAQSFLLHTWKTSMVTGLLRPDASYWLNNMVGDFSQMWFTLGAPHAMTASFRNIPANVPFFGGRFQDAGSRMALKFHGKPVLGPVSGAFFNPGLNAVWRGVEGSIRTTHGEIIPFNQLRQELVEGGILDTFIHEELPQAFSRVVPEWWQRGITGYHDSITQFANFTQQRQRSALYIDLRMMGHVPQDAKRLTLDALYDWKNGVADWEVASVAKMIPYYRYTRLSATQLLTAVSDPLMKPGQGLESMYMGTKLARLRNQIKAVDLLPQMAVWAQPDLQAPYTDLDKQKDALGVYIHQPWMRDKGFADAYRTESEVTRTFQQMRGRVYDYKLHVIPGMTAIDSANLGSSILSGMVMGALAAKEMAGGKGDVRIAPDAMETFWQPALGSTFPWLRQPIEEFMATHDDDPLSVAPGNAPSVTPAQFAAIQKLGFLHSPWIDQEGTEAPGTLRATAGAKFFVDVAPVLSTELIGTLNAGYYDNPYMVKSKQDYARKAFLLQQAEAAKPEDKQQYLDEAARINIEAKDELLDGLLTLTTKQFGLGPYYFSREAEQNRRVGDRAKAINSLLGPVDKTETPPEYGKNPADDPGAKKP